jgi:hypothetical protein
MISGDFVTAGSSTSASTILLDFLSGLVLLLGRAILDLMDLPAGVAAVSEEEPEVGF